VGTSLPNGSEVDATTRLRSNSVIVEWKPQSLLEAGEIVQGLEDHSLDMERIIDLPQMLATKISWRNLSKDIILFKAVGVGLSDLVAARLAVERLRPSTQPGALSSQCRSQKNNTTSAVAG
jgi:ornithine cyclodeaminase